MSTLLSCSWRKFREQLPTVMIRYGSALAVIAVAILLRLWLDPVLDRSGFAIFLTGVLVAAWVGGLGPCLLGQTMILFAQALWFAPAQNPPSAMTLQGILSLVAFYSVGGIVAFLSEARAVAQRRAQAEKDEAISQRNQLRTTLSCMGDGVLVTDARGYLTLMNPVAESMTGWTLPECKGKPVRDVFAILDEQTQRAARNPVECVLSTGEVLHESMRSILTTRNDRRQPVAYSAAPVFDAQGRTTGVVLVFRDETQRRQAEETLRNADKRKDEFLATLAHELRNPLAPICTGLELLKFSAADQQATEEIREMMERQTQQMVRLINDLLDVSRITRGKLELQLSHVVLADAVRNAVDATRPMIEEAQHQLVVSLPQRPIVLCADPNRLTQVLSNLLQNAAKYTPPSGTIELSAEPCDGQVAITVADNGIGILPNQLTAIFEMFSQGRGAMENGNSGLGIGLTLVKRLVEMHRGTVEVKSDGKNCGSKFRVRLPIVAMSPSPAHTAPTTVATTHVVSPAPRHRVLIVDDNKDALNALTRLVGALGSEVYQAHDGVEAIETTERFMPDIVLMDIGMPNLNGYEAARRIRQRPGGRDLVLVATTGWGQEEDHRRTREAGFDHHLVKPVESVALQEIFARLERRRVGEPPGDRPATSEPRSAASVSTGNGHGRKAESAMVSANGQRESSPKSSI